MDLRSHNIIGDAYSDKSNLAWVSYYSFSFFNPMSAMHDADQAEGIHYWALDKHSRNRCDASKVLSLNGSTLASDGHVNHKGIETDIAPQMDK